MSSDVNSLAHTKWNCKYHIVFAPKYRRQVIYGKLKQDIGKILRQLCERKTVGRNKKVIEEYIRNQLQEDIVAEQITMEEYIDPFTGEETKDRRKKKN
ncbi:hypothetical protein PSTEL_05250 [Paenibacillus stellifer]|uniref:Transposase IS200-like domain-containing protein n=1 Tax=Paenibacillus stellifer TaxID=169760 RepID=A0A089LTN3_9BACL|nr:IS200/IS605 family transposase [Paenibacillus stellifer]AIQ62598.1 hypothetical protein PSTEL_05250 [Paenibacillus stellifer]